MPKILRPWYYGLLIFPISAGKILVGELNQIDPTTNLIEVSLREKIPDLENNRVFQVWLGNDFREKPAILEVEDYVKDKNKIIGTIRDYPGRLFAGMKVYLAYLQEDTSRLPDTLKLEKEQVFEKIYPKDGAIGVFIPQGKFIFGSNLIGSVHYTKPVAFKRTRYQEIRGTRPYHYLDLPSFFIDKYEVSRAQFVLFLEEKGMEIPTEWQKGENWELPATGISYLMAEAYCHWAGRRLPTELEWEKAARGSGLVAYLNEKEEFFYQEEPQKYPIGQEYDPQLCNTKESGRGLVSVFAMQDKSPYGVLGMCGNAPEWTSSWFLPYRGNTLPNPMFGRKYKVIRGGAAWLSKKWARVYERMVGGIPSLEEDKKAGFRCAESVL